MLFCIQWCRYRWSAPHKGLEWEEIIRVGEQVSFYPSCISWFQREEERVLQVGLHSHLSLILRVLNMKVDRISGWWQSLYCHALVNRSSSMSWVARSLFAILCSVWGRWKGQISARQWTIHLHFLNPAAFWWWWWWFLLANTANWAKPLLPVLWAQLVETKWVALVNKVASF